MKPSGSDVEVVKGNSMLNLSQPIGSITGLKKILRAFEQLVYPSKCLKCGMYTDFNDADQETMESCFCDTCMGAGFYPAAPPFCLKCGMVFHHITDSGGNHVCETCLKTPLKLDRVRCVAEYKGIIKDAIPLFKYHSKLSLARVFESLLFQAFLLYYAGTGIHLVIPVPLHKKKMRSRGFNQSYLLVRNFVKLYQQACKKIPQWKIDTSSLARIKQTKPQTGFDIDQRRKNLKNAFQVMDKKAVYKKNILLIDDVFTTGATCNEAAGILYKNGVKKVSALVLARA